MALCTVCGQSNCQQCQQSQQPYCEQCSQDNSCAQIMDAACVKYHPDNDVPSRLVTLALPNNISVEAVLEAIDKYLNFNTPPIVPVNSSTIQLNVDGAADHRIKADAKLSATTGNILVANDDGLFVPTPVAQLTIPQIVAGLASNADFATLVCTLMRACFGDCPSVINVS